MKKVVAELFAGVGGFRVGLDRLHAGWTCSYADQWEPGRKNQYAYLCYQKHFGPSKEISNADINKVDKEKIPDMTLLVGGFPCQDYSVAHTGAKGIQGKKGVLWWSIRDVIKAKRPPFILLENVDRLLSSPGRKQRGRDFGMILYTLNKLDYGVQWRIINAAWYGFPQRRRRVFIFACRNDTKYFKKLKSHKLSDDLMNHSVYHKALPIKPEFTRENETNLTKDDLGMTKYKDIVDFSDHFSFYFQNTGIMLNGEVFTAKYEPNYNGHHTTLGDILLPKVSDDSLFLDKKKMKKFEYLKGAKHEKRVSSSGYKYYYSEGNMAFPDNLDKPSRTMLTSEHSVNRSTHVVRDKATGKLRLLSPIECERLQTFPDDWTKGMPKSSRYFMMGNALVCGLITEIGKGIDDIINNE